MKITLFILYFYLMIYLFLSKKINQFINPHYNYLIFLSMFLLGIIAFLEIIKVLCTKDTHHKLSRKTNIPMMIAFIPLIIGFYCPTTSLNSQIVDNKGLQLPVAKDSDFRTEILRPNISMYYNKEFYDKKTNKLLKKYSNLSKIVVNRDNYIEMMDLIYSYPQVFQNKKITMSGFAYKDANEQNHHLFCFRFGIVHCVADAGIFGLLCENVPKNIHDNEWIEVTGIISSTYYEPLKRKIPYIINNTVNIIHPDSNKYVYYNFNK